MDCLVVLFGRGLLSYRRCISSCNLALQPEVFAALSGTSCNIYTVNTASEEGKESSSIETTVSFQADFAEGEDGVVRAMATHEKSFGRSTHSRAAAYRIPRAS